MNLCRLVLCFAAGTLWGAPIVEPCLPLLTAMARNQLDQVEPALLGGFDIELIRAGSAQRLGLGVYKVALKEGFGVIRLSKEPGDLAFERFAAQLLRSTPTLTVPLPKEIPLTQRLSQSLVALEQAQSTPDTETIEKLERGEVEGASLSVFVPAETGAVYLERLAGFEFRKYLTTLRSEFLQLSPKEKTDFKRGLPGLIEERWVNLSDSARRGLLSDLSQNGIATSTRARQNPVKALVALIATPDGDVLDSLRQDVWSHVPPEIQTQLADHWAVSTVVLGISDGHPDNWLVDSGKVLGIDLQMQSVIFARGIPKIHWLAQNSPVGPPPSDALRSKMMNCLSPATRSFLLAMTPESIRAVAVSAGFSEMSDKVIQGMLTRAQMVAAQEP